MIGHEHPGMDVHSELQRSLEKPVGVSLEVSLRGEAGLSVVAALDDVYRKSGRTIAGETRHTGTIAPTSITQ